MDEVESAQKCSQKCSGVGGGVHRAGHCALLPHLVPKRTLRQLWVFSMEKLPWTQHHPRPLAIHNGKLWCLSLSVFRDETHSYKTTEKP